MEKDMSITISKLRDLFKKDKPIIIIGGVAGSGKTTAGNAILHKLELDHKLGVGWIREIIASTTNKEKNPELFTYSFKPNSENISPFEHFTNLSKKLLPSIEACINRARREGQSLIIEGPMIIPGILKPEMYDIFIYLKKPEDSQDYVKALTTVTHTKRKFSFEDVSPNSQIENEMVKICQHFNIPVIPFMNKEKRVDLMINEISNQFLK